ncbi:hypothetical protein ZEAMMB73_Zm00001d039335 [Zea mays]|uniref:Uncharacterized protein n=1 Tax=Zea mays TaxID=4577 RepID=B8A1I8_MAIZE|nr:unknown [Zea mays]ONM28340.1 hypothetical protein ZEAMMB73_Zm00001d039335 [Zea mays]|eukprot:NP_001146456.1 uncharacterized protein LOC100280042 [Zea mays]
MRCSETDRSTSSSKRGCASCMHVCSSFLLICCWSFNLSPPPPSWLVATTMAGWKRASFSPLRGGARVELAADSFTHMPSKRPWKPALQMSE